MQSVLVRVAWLCLIGFCFLGVHTKAHAAQRIDPTTTETNNKKGQNQAWAPLPPPRDKFDWIQLTSGEWLKGELKRLYDRRIEFDSDKLGLQEFDWEDVKQVRGSRIFSVRFEGPLTVGGILQVTGSKVIVTVGDEQREFKRDQLIAIAPRGDKEVDYWSGKISFGFNFAEGNTEQTQYTATANMKRRSSETRFIVDYFGNLTKTDGVESVNNHRIEGKFDIFRTRNYFYRPVFGEYYRDPLKNIRYRVTLGSGIGYHIIDTPKTEWDVAGGPAYQSTRFDSVEPGQDSSEWTPALVAGTNFNTELTKNIDFIFDYTFQILNEASGTYTHHSVTTLETELTNWLDFDTSFVWDRVQNPTRDDDGKVPKKDDFYLILSLGIDF